MLNVELKSRKWSELLCFPAFTVSFIVEHLPQTGPRLVLPAFPSQVLKEKSNTASERAAELRQRLSSGTHVF